MKSVVPNPIAKTVVIYLADVGNSLALRFLGVGTEDLPVIGHGEDAPRPFDCSVQRLLVIEVALDRNQ